MKRRDKILIAVAIVIAVAATAHFGGPAIIAWVISMHS